MKLSDNVIAHIAKLLQMAIITGTDVVDNLRMIRLESENGSDLDLTDEYEKAGEKNIETMLSELRGLNKEASL
jgi:hypothetical protein